MGETIDYFKNRFIDSKFTAISQEILIEIHALLVGIRRKPRKKGRPGAKPLYPFGGDGVALGGGGDTIPANDGDQPKLGDYHRWSSGHKWSSGHQWSRRLLSRSGFSSPDMMSRKT
jgi:hypothetical protein